MARTGRPRQPLVLSDEERLVLETLGQQAKSAQALALRARIVLSAPGLARPNLGVAAELGVNPATVGKWRSRTWPSAQGLSDEDRPGAPAGSPTTRSRS